MTKRSILTRTRDAIRSWWTGPLTTSDPALARLFGSGYESASGITVTTENAFTFSAVFDAVNQLSSDVAKLPLVLRKRRKNGGSDPYQESKTYRLLKNKSNPEMTAFEFRRTLMAHALTCHGGYAEIERNGAGQPIALWLLTPDRVELVREERRTANGRLTFGPLRYRIDNGQTFLEPENVLHIKGLGYDGYLGYSVIHKARQAIGLALAAESFGGNVFKQARYGGILNTEDDLDPEQQALVRDSVEKFKQGYQQYLLLFGRMWKYQQTAVTSQDAQLQAVRDQQVEEVARFFNMPLYKLKVNKPGAVSYASVEMTALEYYKGPILTWITNIEQEFEAKLIPTLEASQQFVKHNANAFLRGDIKTRYEALGIARDKGIINADEWRDLEDMNPQEGGQGQLYLVQSAQVPLNKLTEMVDSQITKNETPPASPAPPPADDAGDDDNRALEVLKERAERAEQLLRETIDSATTAREQAAALEASGMAKDETIAALRAAEAAHLAHAATFAEISEQLRVDYRTALASKDAALERAAEERSELMLDRDAAQEAATVAQAQLAELKAARVSILTELELAQSAALEAKTISRETAQTAREALAERDETIAQADRADQKAREALAHAEQLREDVTASERARAHADARADHAVEMATQALAKVEAAERLASEAAEQRHVAQAAANVAEGARAELAARLADLKSREAEVREQLETAQKAIKAGSERDAAVMAAHREAVVDIMRRMLERETDRARRAQATPEKLRHWMATFYDSHTDLVTTALLRAMAIHVAWTGQDLDPHGLARQWAESHVAESIRQLTAVLDGDAEDLAGSLAHLFTRWDQTRMTTIADALFRTEMDYARTRG